jgi:hypothetical protein
VPEHGAEIGVPSGFGTLPIDCQMRREHSSSITARLWPLSVTERPVALPPLHYRDGAHHVHHAPAQEQNVHPKQRHVLELAFNDTLRKLNLVNRGDPICEIVARKVIEIGSDGASDAAAITEIAFVQLCPDNLQAAPRSGSGN